MREHFFFLSPHAAVAVHGRRRGPTSSGFAGRSAARAANREERFILIFRDSFFFLSFPSPCSLTSFPWQTVSVLRMLKREKHFCSGFPSGSGKNKRAVVRYGTAAAASPWRKRREKRRGKHAVRNRWDELTDPRQGGGVLERDRERDVTPG